MTDDEFKKTLKFKIGDVVNVKTYDGLCKVEIIDIDITAHRPNRLQNPYKIRYEWGETRWTDFQ